MSLWRRAMVGVFLLALALPGAAPTISIRDRPAYSSLQPSSLSVHPSAAPVLDAVGIPLSSLPSLPSVRGLQSFGSTGRYHEAETGLMFYREAAERMESNLDLAYTVTQGVQRTADTASLVLGWGAVIRGGAVVVTTHGGRALVRFTIAQGAAVGTGMLANTAMGRALEEAGIDPQYAELAMRGIGLYQLGRAYRAESAARGRQPPQADAQEVVSTSGPSSTQTRFIGRERGPSVHMSQTEMVESITDAGAVHVGPSTATTEMGERFHLNTPNGPIEVRVMAGQQGGGDLQGPRTIVTRPGTREFVQLDGARIEGAVPISQRRAIGHVHGQRN